MAEKVPRSSAREAAAPYVAKRSHALFRTWKREWKDNLRGWLNAPYLKIGEGYMPMDDCYSYNDDLRVDTDMKSMCEGQTFYLKNIYNFGGHAITEDSKRTRVQTVVEDDFRLVCNFMENCLSPNYVQRRMHAMLVAETPTMKAFLGLYSDRALITQVEMTCEENVWIVKLSGAWMGFSEQRPYINSFFKGFEDDFEWQKVTWEAGATVLGDSIPRNMSTEHVKNVMVDLAGKLRVEAEEESMQEYATALALVEDRLAVHEM